MVARKLTQRQTISLDEATSSELEEIAEEADVSVSWLIRYAIANFLRERQQGQHLQLVLFDEGRS